MAHDMLDLADAGDHAAQRIEPGLVVPAVGDQQFPAGSAGRFHEIPCLVRIEAHRLFDEDVAALFQKRLGVRVMQVVRRGDDRDVDVAVEDLGPVLRGEGEAEFPLDQVEFGSAKAAHAVQRHLGPRRKNRDMHPVCEMPRADHGSLQHGARSARHVKSEDDVALMCSS